MREYANPKNLRINLYVLVYDLLLWIRFFLNSKKGAFTLSDMWVKATRITPKKASAFLHIFCGHETNRLIEIPGWKRRTSSLRRQRAKRIHHGLGNLVLPLILRNFFRHEFIIFTDLFFGKQSQNMHWSVWKTVQPRYVRSNMRLSLQMMSRQVSSLSWGRIPQLNDKNNVLFPFSIKFSKENFNKFSDLFAEIAAEYVFKSGDVYYMVVKFSLLMWRMLVMSDSIHCSFKEFM